MCPSNVNQPRNHLHPFSEFEDKNTFPRPLLPKPVDCQGHRVSVKDRGMLQSGVRHPSCLRLGSSLVPEPSWAQRSQWDTGEHFRIGSIPLRETASDLVSCQRRKVRNQLLGPTLKGQPSLSSWVPLCWVTKTVPAHVLRSLRRTAPPTGEARQSIMNTGD